MSSSRQQNTNPQNTNTSSFSIKDEHTKMAEDVMSEFERKMLFLSAPSGLIDAIAKFAADVDCEFEKRILNAVQKDEDALKAFFDSMAPPRGNQKIIYGKKKSESRAKAFAGLAEFAKYMLETKEFDFQLYEALERVKAAIEARQYETKVKQDYGCKAQRQRRLRHQAASLFMLNHPTFLDNLDNYIKNGEVPLARPNAAVEEKQAGQSNGANVGQANGANVGQANIGQANGANVGQDNEAGGGENDVNMN